MTPQERKLLDELFDRLATLENGPRDPEAVRAINEGLQRAPNALYPLVQSVLVQDEALKRADARIREFESELGIEQPQAGGQQPGFLDNMRDTLFGRRESQGSVPTVRPGSSSPWGDAARQPHVYGQPSGYAQPAQAAPAPGGSFLGTAAAAVAGVVGGALLMNSFRGMFGGQQGQGHSVFDQGGSGGAPWAPSGSGDLSRQAGIDDIGRGGRAAAYDDNSGSARQGAFDVAQNDVDSDVADSDFDLGDVGDGGSDTA